MKSLAIVIGLPALSIAFVSLYAMGGAARWAGSGLLVVSVIGIAASAFSQGKSRTRKDH